MPACDGFRALINSLVFSFLFFSLHECSGPLSVSDCFENAGNSFQIMFADTEWILFPYNCILCVVYLCVRVLVSVFMSDWALKDNFLRAPLCIFVCLRAFVCVCVFVCVCACVRACVRACE